MPEAYPLPARRRSMRLRRLPLLFLLAGASLPLACSGQPAAQPPMMTPMAADGFVDSVGINVHLHNANTPYGNFPVIAAALKDLGIRHTRDGLIPTTWQEYYRRHAELARSGIHCDYITGPGQTDGQIRQFLTDVHGAAESLEGPNEYDQAGDPHWAEKLARFMPRLSRLAKNASGPALRVIGPSLIGPDAPRQVPGISASFDAANMHDYFGGRPPGTAGWGENGYGSIAWNLVMARRSWGPKPVVTTETGYLTDTRQKGGVTEEVQALYLPRVLLEQWMHGIQRTYLYELSDGNSVISEMERSFGLLRADGSRKPAFDAVRRIVDLLNDPGPAFVPRPVAIGFTSSAPDVHQLLLQKRNGVCYLAFWRELSSTEDGETGRRRISPVAVRIFSQKPVPSAQLHHLGGPEVSNRLSIFGGKYGVLTLNATDEVSILEFRPSP